MPDWSRLVRERLPALHVRPERKNEIIAELAVIGVMPADFRYAGEPLAGSATEIAGLVSALGQSDCGLPRSVRFLKVAARLREGVTAAHGREEARRLGLALSSQHPEFDRGFDWDARPLSEQVTGKMRVGVKHYWRVARAGWPRRKRIARIAPAV